MSYTIADMVEHIYIYEPHRSFLVSVGKNIGKVTQIAHNYDGQVIPSVGLYRVSGVEWATDNYGEHAKFHPTTKSMLNYHLIATEGEDISTSQKPVFSSITLAKKNPGFRQYDIVFTIDASVYD